MLTEDLDDDVDQAQFDKIVSEEKKHRELINSIRGLMTALKPIDNTDKISQLVSSNKVAVDGFLSKLKEISATKPVTPQINENKEIIEISNDIKQLFTEIKELLTEKKQWDFKVVRDNYNNLTGVTAIQINSKK